jgi:hypothetical protein
MIVDFGLGYAAIDHRSPTRWMRSSSFARISGQLVGINKLITSGRIIVGCTFSRITCLSQLLDYRHGMAGPTPRDVLGLYVYAYIPMCYLLIGSSIVCSHAGRYHQRCTGSIGTAGDCDTRNPESAPM